VGEAKYRQEAGCKTDLKKSHESELRLARSGIPADGLFFRRIYNIRYWNYA